MTYELAKQLKEAGFQCGHTMDMDSGTWCTHCPYDRAQANSGFEDMCFPTLSELIAACGDRFSSMDAMHYLGKISTWRVREEKQYHGGRDNLLTIGETPEEAVANLWLLLNKK